MDPLTKHYGERLEKIRGYYHNGHILRAAAELGKYAEEKKLTDGNGRPYHFNEEERFLCVQVAKSTKGGIFDEDISIKLYKSFSFSDEEIKNLENEDYVKRLEIGSMRDRMGFKQRLVVPWLVSYLLKLFGGNGGLEKKLE